AGGNQKGLRGKHRRSDRGDVQEIEIRSGAASGGVGRKSRTVLLGEKCRRRGSQRERAGIHCQAEQRDVADQSENQTNALASVGQAFFAQTRAGRVLRTKVICLCARSSIFTLTITPAPSITGESN